MSIFCLILYLFTPFLSKTPLSVNEIHEYWSCTVRYVKRSSPEEDTFFYLFVALINPKAEKSGSELSENKKSPKGFYVI